MASESDIERIRSSRHFDRDWYLAAYPDVRDLGMDPAEHYLLCGAAMGRDPSPGFDTRHYMRTAMAGADGENPLVHHARAGKTAARPLPGTSDGKVWQLYHQLWGGRPDHAAPRLAAIFADEDTGWRARYLAGCRLATWHDFQGDPARARRILRRIGRFPDEYALGKERLVMLAFLEQRTGRAAAARALLESAPALRDDTDVRLALANGLSDDGARLAAINALLRDRGVTELARADPAAPLALGNLVPRQRPAPAPSAGKVSIVMPAYMAEETLPTAIASLRAQSYADFELIVVDDCSPDATYDVARALARADSRIRVVRQRRNSGAYAARNRGLDLVTGAFVATHDADDWSHPDKLAIQVAALAAGPDLAGTISHWARAHDDLIFTPNWRLTHQLVHPSHSSFMVRRQVVEALGRWDQVRVSADTEFIWRVQAAYGKASVKKLRADVPLAFGRDAASSLTRTKMTHVSSTYYGLRHYYREVSRWWHQNRPLGLTAADRRVKAGMLPREMFVASGGPQIVDMHVIGDFSEPEVGRRIAALAAPGGLTVGITDRPSTRPDRMRARDAHRFCDEVMEALARPNVLAVVPGAELQAGRVVDLSTD
jgi:hypothetical protein